MVLYNLQQRKLEFWSYFSVISFLWSIAKEGYSTPVFSNSGCNPILFWKPSKNPFQTSYSITFSFICVNILSFTDNRESKASMSSQKLNWTQCKDLVYLKSRFQSLGVANLMGLDDLATFQRWCLFQESSLTIHVMIHVEYWELLYSSHVFNVCLSIPFE